MSGKQKFTEQDLARIVVAKLQEWGWEVFQEVEGPGGRCDIVARNGNIQWAIECKMSFGFGVMDQAFNWRNGFGRYFGTGHYVSIAVPYKSAPNGGSLGHRICQEHGIGILRVRLEEWSQDVEEQVKPRLNRKAHRFDLYEDQKTAVAAGGNSGGHSTNFKRTKKALISAVVSQPGIAFNELVKTLDHHYSSLSTAKSCLRGFIGTHVIPELRTQIVDCKLCVFPAEIKEEAA